ncbi:MAG: hypothetical protein SOW78_02305 [Clostridia bacterium]|nr:hypothetical protein [Clostridia bacterium]
MKLPMLYKNIRREEKIIKSFGGINTSETYSVGELFGAENMSSDYAPALCSRKKRECILESEREINGLFGFDELFYTSYDRKNNLIYLTYGGIDYDMSSYSSSTDYSEKRSFAALSGQVLIIPDNVLFNTNSRTFTKVCISQKHNEPTAKEKFETESSGSDYLARSSWVLGKVTHNKITAEKVSYPNTHKYDFYHMNFDDDLKAGDVITVKMLVSSDKAPGSKEYSNYVKKMLAGITLKIKDITTVTHSTLSGESITEKTELIFDDNNIDTFGLGLLEIEELSIEKGIPKIECMCSFNNRVWAAAGKEIYTSKLGDAGEWNDFTVDDYGTLPYACFTASAQTEGGFTGITSYGSYIYAFKENTIHKIYGDEPDEYKLYTTEALGIAEKYKQCCTKTADSLIYAARDGIYLFRDNYPKRISDKTANGIIPRAMASHGDKCYILSGDDKKCIYVYDVSKDIWQCENADSDINFLISYSGNVYAASKNKIICLTECNDEDKSEKNIYWSFKIKFDEKLINKKCFGKAAVRYSLGKNSSFTVKAVYDDDTRGAVCGAQYDEKDIGGCTVHLPIKRCLCFYLEFKGIGEFSLKSIKFSFFNGTEF